MNFAIGSFVIKVGAAQCHQSIVEIFFELTSVPNSLNVAPPEGILGAVIIRGNVLTGGFPYDPWAGKSDFGRTYAELIE
jgi:hypothetical protein